jgi:hypothetical protein
VALYFIRVELRGTPTSETYDNLHELMTGKGWSQSIAGTTSEGKAVTVELPHAVYTGHSNEAALPLANALKKSISTEVWKNVIVLGIEGTNWGQSQN